MVSGAFEHLLAFGDMRELTDEELARAVHLDPSQIAGLGPSLESLMEMLRERKQKILETYETERVQAAAERRYRELGEQIQPPKHLKDRYRRSVRARSSFTTWSGSGIGPTTSAASSPGSSCS